VPLVTGTSQSHKLETDMEGITVILSAYRRPHTLAAQLAAVRVQSVKPQVVWLWANEPDEGLRETIDRQSLDRVVCPPAGYLCLSKG
jgi:hypothetical protein